MLPLCVGHVGLDVRHSRMRMVEQTDLTHPFCLVLSVCDALCLYRSSEEERRRLRPSRGVAGVGASLRVCARRVRGRGLCAPVCVCV